MPEEELNPLKVTPPGPARKGPTLPSPAKDPDPLQEVTMFEPRGASAAVTDDADFATQVAATSPGRLGVFIPESFLSKGMPGTLLRLVPVETLRGKEALELFFRRGDTFSLGRSPEADWVTCFFPRNDRNDQRSKRLSKVHARIEFQKDQLQIHGVGNAVVRVGALEVDTGPIGSTLRERDQIVLADDYAFKIHYDRSLGETLQFTNGDLWRAGKIELNQGELGAIRFEPVNSELGFRNSCWLFVDVGIGNERGGGFVAGAELAPQQGSILTVGDCFWLLNLVNNDKLAVNDHRLATRDVVPLTHGDSVWLGAVRYRAEIS